MSSTDTDLSPPKSLLSLVVPVYFEEDCIEQFILEVTEQLEALKEQAWEIVFIDDGSKDATVAKIREQASRRPELKLVELAYNHGKAAAFTAGVHYARGDYLLYMDPDLQDPPAEIPRFLEEIGKGYDLVLGTRKVKQDTLLNRLFSSLFWWILDRFTDLQLPRPLAVMRIFNRKFAYEFLKYGETNRFIEGIFMRISMKWTAIEIEQRPRFAGVTKFSFQRKLNLAWNAIFDYSELPLRLATKLGILLVFLGLVSASALVYLRLFVMEFQVGWPSLFVFLIVGFGLQIFFLGLIGTYVGKIYLESKRRPLFSVRDLVNIQP